MKRLVLAAAMAALWFAPSAQAGDRRPSWIFSQSYYSHEPARPVQIGRRYAGGPLFTRPTGDYFTVGTRYMNSAISVGPYTWDNVRMYESWTQSGSQY